MISDRVSGTRVIRTALPAEAESVAALHARARATYYPDGVPEDGRDWLAAWRGVIERPDAHVLCVVESGRIVAVASFRTQDGDPADTVTLFQFHVDPDQWRSGLGTALHAACVEQWRADGRMDRRTRCACRQRAGAGLLRPAGLGRRAVRRRTPPGDAPAPDGGMKRAVRTFTGETESLCLSPVRPEESRRMRVEIWSDIACPWCYVGKARFEKALDAFPHRDGVEVVHRSFELDPGRAKGDTQPVLKMLTKKYGMSEAQAQAGEDNLGAQAAAEGLDYRTRDRDHGNTFDMHRLLHFAKAQGRQDELIQALYKANFAEERSVFDSDERLVELAVGAGLVAEDARKVLADPTAYADDVRADEREAAELGANGVPFFVLDRKYGVSGAQPAEVFAQALTQAWGEHSPLKLIDSGADGGAEACGPDGCAVPQA